VEKLKRHLSFANVMSCLALFMAMSGVAFAASHVTRNSVKAQHLKKGAVTTAKLRNGAVTTPKIRNGAVVASKLRDGSVVAGKLANGSVRATSLGGGVVTTPKLNNGAVNESKLANGAVTNPKLGANAVATGKVEDGALTGAKLAPTLLAQLVKNVSYVTKQSDSNGDDSKTITAECPSGRQVTGGGARFVPDTFEGSVYSVDSFPALNVESKRTGWTVSAREIATVDPGTWAVEAYAICAEF
jgi:hypothetical protein